MSASYRFFAPNPDPTKKLYFRIIRLDGSVRWVEYPHRQDYGTLFVYHRYWKIAQQITWKIPRANGRPRPGLSRESKVCIASMARKIASIDDSSERDRQHSPVEFIEVYGSERAFMTPAQARAGYSRTALKLYSFAFLGRYAADGDRVGGGAVHEIKREVFVAQFLARDLLPLLKSSAVKSTPTKLAVAETLGAPEPVRDLLVASPELLDGPSDRVAILDAINEGTTDLLAD